MISVRDFPARDLLQANYSSPVFDKAKESIAEAAAIVLATPFYKGAYSGSLKTFLGLLPQSAFRGKTLLPIGTGGSSHPPLATGDAVKPLLSRLAAADVLQGVYAVDTQFRIDRSGKTALGEEVIWRLNDAVEQLVANIKARSLVAARFYAQRSSPSNLQGTSSDSYDQAWLGPLC